jgi:uncharacterized 2Fe-2S/4Fe-4S cluster protein (DUF4445 family)
MSLCFGWAWEVGICCGVFPYFSSDVISIGNARFAVATYILYSLCSRKSVLAMDDLVHACCLSLERCNEPPYLAEIYLVRPCYIIPSWHGSLRACINC